MKAPHVATPSITRKWTRFLAVGCTHGELIDPVYEQAIFEFKKRFKPTRIFHLGDWCDTAALRAGSKGTDDESRPISPDIERGLQFLEQLGVTDCSMGNHDERPWRFLKSPSSREKELGQMFVKKIDQEMKRLGINWVSSWSIRHWIWAYGFKWMHGYILTENSARDHAEAHGNVVFAHTHTTMLQKGRRDDNPTGICVGTGTRMAEMDYAKTRRKTLSWSQGFAYGEGCGNEMGWIQLHENGQKKEWRLPV